MSSPAEKTFETFPNPHPDNDYVVTIAAPEFTCLCPVTGHPDFATITVDYAPGERIVELRSFKLYLQSFRNEGHHHEGVPNGILNDLVTATSPRRMTVTADYTVRGGIHTVVTASYVRPDNQ
ncbi:MAG: 7-cyano-7-deazaguanine reductase [Thermomicrobiales bacterium]|jgi:7-cyano-7-deazaguanine reductase|nr:7-cyano-7-deazaguanine reductase [Thermomicrobiales bacterium]